MVAGAAFPAPEPPALDLEDDMKIRAITLLLAAAALAAPAHAQQAPAGMALQPPVERPVMGNFVGEHGVTPQLTTACFITGHPDGRSEASSVGQEGVSTWRSVWAPYHYQQRYI